MKKKRRFKGERPVDKDLNKRVRARDNYTCQLCKKKKRPYSLEIHHIKRWADAPLLRYAESNLITLCRKCHKSITGKEVYYERYFIEVLYGNKKRK